MLLALGVWVFVARSYLSTANSARGMSALLQASGRLGAAAASGWRIG